MRGILLLLLLVCSTSFAAVGDLTVTPTRIIFEGRDRSAQVGLINRGQETATYRIEFIQYRMDENGQLVDITEPNEREKFADHLIRFSPRQVTLQPNEAQTVRLLLRKPPDLPAGEYRSHLLFYAVPEGNVGNSIEVPDSADPNAFSIAITSIFRISIPVIVRHGELSADFVIDKAELNLDEQPKLALQVSRQGNRSVYGDLDIYYLPGSGDQATLLNQLKDFVLYTSSDTRRLEVDLHIPDGVELNGGELLIDYKTSEEGLAGPLLSHTIPLE